jgi:hypothetical protein
MSLEDAAASPLDLIEAAPEAAPPAPRVAPAAARSKAERSARRYYPRRSSRPS